MNAECLRLPNRGYFHGTDVPAALSILRQGFRVWRPRGPDGERVASDGNLGRGIYITNDHRVALFFGQALLRVEIAPGTRILDASLPPGPKTIRSLVREFGRTILTDSPWKVLPRNKRLTLPELVALLRYHYVGAWEKGDAFGRWPPRREQHFKRLDDLRSVFVRYGLHGFGNPADDNGIVVFAEDRLVPRELVAVAPWTELTQEFRDTITLAELVRRFAPARAEQRR